MSELESESSSPKQGSGLPTLEQVACLMNELSGMPQLLPSPGYIIDHSSINTHGQSPQVSPQIDSLTVIRRVSWEGRGLGLGGGLCS